MSAAAVLPAPSLHVDDLLLSGLGPSWTRIDHVPFGATVDVEQVLLATSGIAVVTTLAAVPTGRDPVSEARWRARKIEFLLDRVARVPAAPILVVPGGSPLGEGLRDGVLVARADDAVCWLEHLEAGSTPIAPDDLGEMIDVLVHHTQRTELVNASFAR
jgi:hypothetical protein